MSTCVDCQMMWLSPGSSTDKLNAIVEVTLFFVFSVRSAIKYTQNKVTNVIEYSFVRNLMC